MNRDGQVGDGDGTGYVYLREEGIVRAGRGEPDGKMTPPAGAVHGYHVLCGYNRGQGSEAAGSPLPPMADPRVQPIDSGRNEAGHAKENLREANPCTTLSQRTVRAKAQQSKMSPAQV